MRVMIVPNGPESWGSARIRGYWVAKYWDEADIVAPDLDANDYDAVILHKVSDDAAQNVVGAIQQAGTKVIWDICDPMWWWHPGDCAQMAHMVDHITCSTSALACALLDDVVGVSIDKVSVIPDAQDPEFYPSVREHEEVNRVNLIWFGISQNRISLHGVIPYLLRAYSWGYSFSLTILDETPDVPFFNKDNPIPVRHLAWDLSTFHDVLVNHDVALLPPYPGAWGKLKSDNKAHTAFWSGLPRVSGEDWGHLLSCLESAVDRAREGLLNRSVAERCYDVRDTIDLWRQTTKKVVSNE